MIKYLIKLGEQVYRFGGISKIEKLLPRFASNKTIKREIMKVRNADAKWLKNLRKTDPLRYKAYRADRVGPYDTKEKEFLPEFERKKITKRVSLLPKATRYKSDLEDAAYLIGERRKKSKGLLTGLKLPSKGIDSEILNKSINDYSLKQRNIKRG